MPRDYRSSVKVTSHKAPRESPHPRPLEQALHGAAAEEDRHDVAQEHRYTGAEEAAQSEHRTHGDTHIPPDTRNPDEIQAAPDTHVADNAGRTGINFYKTNMQAKTIKP